MRVLTAIGIAGSLTMSAADVSAQLIRPVDIPEPPTKLAVEAAEAAIDACAANGYRVAVSIVDEVGGQRVLVVGDTQSQLGGFAYRKARTAALFAMPSGDVDAQAKTEPQLAARLAADNTFLTWAGGLPMYRAGHLLGAIGVGGAPGGDKDEACAKAGLAKIADRLK